MAAAAPKAAPKETEEGGEKKKSPVIKIVIFAVAGIALIGTGFGSALLYMKLASPKDENPLAIVIEKKTVRKGDRLTIGDLGSRAPAMMSCATSSTRRRFSRGCRP